MIDSTYNALLGQKLIAAFQKRNFEGYYCATKEEALQKALELLPQDASVSCGGSATLYEIGLIEALKNGPYQFLDPNGVEGTAAKDTIAHQALGVDYFLMGCNAITEAGELVNADGIGNRVAALIFGPRHVLVIAGLNKVEPTTDAAVLRVTQQAARKILLKFNQNYASLDELDQIASGATSQLVITQRSVIPGRIKILLVGEHLGF